MVKKQKEYDYLIHLVRCGIHGLQPQEPSEGMDFRWIFECGKFHQIANIAFYSLEKLKNKPEPELYCQWEAYRDQALMCDITQSFAAQELRHEMDAQGIRYVEVQGTKIKPLYPQPDFRTMSDIDFIIDEENIPKAKELLEGLGYECQTVYQVELNGDRPPNTYVEMHTEYFLGDYKFRQVMNSPFDHVDEQGQCTDDAFYLYNILHIAKHYFFSGCGIRRVLDVYFLNQKYPRCVRSPYVQKGLENAELTDFVAEIGQLADSWFGSHEQSYPRSKMVSYILNSGIHGSQYNWKQNALEKRYQNTGRFSRVKYCLKRFCGDREHFISRYPVLEKHKILYPVCWIHRAFSAMRPGNLKAIRQEWQIVKQIDKGDAE